MKRFTLFVAFLLAAPVLAQPRPDTRSTQAVIINNCVAEPYRQMLKDYVAEANQGGGQTPHVMEKAFSWHTRFRDTGSMLAPQENPVVFVEENEELLSI